jgi:hypothetical protein
MNGTCVVYGALIMLATMLVIRSMWPGRRLRNIDLALFFFGGIEAVVAGFTPQDLQPFLHSLSGGLAIASLNIGLIFLGLAAIKTWRAWGWLSLFFGLIGMSGMVMDGIRPYAGLGYGVGSELLDIRLLFGVSPLESTGFSSYENQTRLRFPIVCSLRMERDILTTNQNSDTKYMKFESRSSNEKI